ncbi:dolichol-phosphate mannosyltransferase subunit 3-like [Lineus longissimus]|uniref:dolichol-phosphate mannosyltransferase subunit 3-like n=1 Tax=Lineus longissimus TaxID=88925 RepID=UPI002B4D787D
MTKLMQWLLFALLFLSVWAALITESIPVDIPKAYLEVIWLFPIYFLITVACIVLAVLGYRVAMFNECDEAAEELKQQIKEAKADLKRKGLKLS